MTAVLDPIGKLLGGGKETIKSPATAPNAITPPRISSDGKGSAGSLRPNSPIPNAFGTSSTAGLQRKAAIRKKTLLGAAL